MKKIKMARLVGLADEKFVEEARPSLKKNNKVLWRRAALIAACLTLVTAMAAAILLPMMLATIDGEYTVNRDRLPSVLKQYEETEYLDLAIAFYEYQRRSIENEQNREIRSVIRELLTFATDGVDDTNIAAPNAGEDGYVEVTDNQVEGVIEADIIKRTKTHVFYKDRYKISVYKIDGENTELVSEYNFQAQDQNVYQEMYLTEDGRTLILLGSDRDALDFSSEDASLTRITATRIKFLNVSNPRHITERKTVSITGDYSSSRLVDGKLLVVSDYYVRKIDCSDKRTLLPHVNTGSGYKPVAAESVIFPERLDSQRYAVVSQLDVDTCLYEDSVSLLGYSSDIYVSKDKIFLTRGYSAEGIFEADGKRLKANRRVTDISAVSFGGDGFEYLGGATVEGRVLNQYSMDEHEGILRVATTTTKFLPDRSILIGLNKQPDSVWNASLYCIDISTWETVGTVENFAPDGESIQSVRFDGTDAYVCTAETTYFLDPVYFFDLSDMSNITYTDTGTIDGYSHSLVDFGDGYLLGIGFGADSGILKIEMYAEEGDKVVSLASYEKENVRFSSDYKDYFIDREKGLIGLAYYQYTDTYRDRYTEFILLHFNGSEFEEIVCERYGDVGEQSFRAVIEGDHLYIFCSGEFRVKKIY